MWIHGDKGEGQFMDLCGMAVSAIWPYEVTATTRFPQGLRYGFLTTHRDTFFIKYIGPKQYAVTNGFLCTATCPSVPELLFCE